MREVVADNASTLTELCVGSRHSWADEDIRALLEAATALQLLQASVVVVTDRQVARAMLRNQPPFQALRLQKLYVAGYLETADDVVAFSSELRCHTSLQGLGLTSAALDTAAAMGAIVDACIALGLRELQLGAWRGAPAVLSELTRLIAAGVLRELIVYDSGVALFGEAHESTRLFVAAVRASAMTKLQLDGLWGELPDDVVQAAAFINARQQ